MIIVNAAVRDDGASKAYVDPRFPAVPNTDLLNACIESAKENDFPFHVGIAHSHESFYIDDNEQQEAYWSKLGVLGADMETAAVFTVAAIRGIKAASILNNVVVCGNDTAQSVADYASGEDLCAKGEKNPSRYGGVGMAELAGRNFTVFGQGSYSLEFLITLSYLALLSGGEHPEELLGRCLEKF